VNAKKVNAKEEKAPKDGCNVELTALRFGSVNEISEKNAEGGSPFWTIGFEAFDDENRVQDILSEALTKEFADERYLRELINYLNAEHSDSYPSWLARMTLFV
jgi:hypothetical protein